MSKVLDSYSPERKDNSFKGDRYERHSSGSGKTEWHSIIKTHQGGKDMKNEYGGYSSVATGSPRYIDRKWKHIKKTYNDPRLTQRGIGEEITTLSKVKAILETKKEKKFVELDEARHSLGGGTKGKAGAKGQDTEGDDHPIMQLRSIKDLRGGSMTFKDKSKHEISHDHASKALELYSRLNKPHEKEAFTNQVGASHKSFMGALAGAKPEEPPKNTISLGGVRKNNK